EGGGLQLRPVQPQPPDPRLGRPAAPGRRPRGTLKSRRSLWFPLARSFLVLRLRYELGHYALQPLVVRELPIPSVDVEVRRQALVESGREADDGSARLWS